jgi:hypothetical protein
MPRYPRRDKLGKTRRGIAEIHKNNYVDCTDREISIVRKVALPDVIAAFSCEAQIGEWEVMKGVARIFFGTGAVFLPSQTPYDQEMLFDYLEQSARQFGEISFELDRQRWQVDANPVHTRPCWACGRGLETLMYTLGRRVLCPRCARRVGTRTYPVPLTAGERKGSRRKEPRQRPRDARYRA